MIEHVCIQRLNSKNDISNILVLLNSDQVPDLGVHHEKLKNKKLLKKLMELKKTKIKNFLELRHLLGFF